jgi:diguanylate cyclase (GGDEF)-like protein
MKGIHNTMPPFSIRTFLFVFVFITFILFSLLGFKIYQQVDKVNQVILTDNIELARAELKASMRQILSTGQYELEQLLQWNEIQQQLDESTFYIYWREQRINNSHKLANYIETLELYDRNGDALAKLPYAVFPYKLPQLKTYFSQDMGHTSLYLYAPVPVNTILSQANNYQGKNNLKGYIGIRINFVKALNQLTRFRHIEHHSISIAAIDEKFITPETLLKHVQFEVTDNPYSNIFYTLIYQNLRNYFILLVILASLIFWFVLQFLSRPLIDIEHYINALRTGTVEQGVDNLNPSIKIKEIESLRQSLTNYQSELDTVHNTLDKKNAKLWQLAHHDALTGVFNRRAFDEDWPNLQKLVEDQNISVSFLLFDCDHFKAINDTYGHETGDKVIQIIAESINRSLRTNDKLYRIGGDEFAAIILNTELSQIKRIVERCNSNIEEYTFSRLGINEPVKVSTGLAHSEGNEIVNFAELHRQADIAMYHAKSSPQNLIQYTPEINQNNSCLVSSRIVNAVLDSINNAQNIKLHYQAILNCARNEVEYYEVLMRIENNNELIFPKDIFPIIERHALEKELDHAVIKELLLNFKQKIIPEKCGVSINLSAATLVQPNMHELFIPFLPYLPTHKIVIEITETALITHLQYANDNLEKLRRDGFIVALDDFGSGYSSIRYLANMPIDIVKFDITMVHDLKKNKRTRTIIEDTAKLILDAGFQLVAEGIETEEIRDLVNEMGATHLQGYLIGRPGPLT